MASEVFKVIDPGLGLSLQDRGRAGWRRFGVPPSGVMDVHAAGLANQLLNNPPEAPVLELLLQGARLEVLKPAWIALTGGDFRATIPQWRAVRVVKGDAIEFPRNRFGVWAYLAVEGGFVGECLFGSVSAYPRGRIGRAIAAGDRLARDKSGRFQLAEGVAARWVCRQELRDYGNPPPLRVWPAPQWREFSEATRDRLFTQQWIVSATSDRVGYRLEGNPLACDIPEMVSEPVLVGTLQIPPNGLPIVTMRDGPTVGGYPKIGLVDPRDLPWLAQCRPGTRVRFEPASITDHAKTSSS